MGKDELRTIRLAIAAYIRSEGCSCCENRTAHERAAKRLGKLVGARPYNDGSGYDFSKVAEG